MKKILYILLMLVVFGCETALNPELGTPAEILVVDAWINQKMERQEVRIIRSQPYFENTVPEKVKGAQVSVQDLNTGTVYEFQEGPASYYWDPVDAPFGEEGHHYLLRVELEGEAFIAHASLGRVPPVDSIKFSYNAEDLNFNQPYYSAEFLASDPPGVGDAYWIKAWRNGVFLGKPEELNYAFDAGFMPGQTYDGNTFLVSIRKSFINPFDENPEKEGELLPPYKVGDSLYVEIHSLSPLAFDFLFGMGQQINRPGGFAEFFATPLANTATNIKCAEENADTKVTGFFNVSAVSTKGQRLTDEIAELAKQMAGE